jgi:hypothetical protein
MEMLNPACSNCCRKKRHVEGIKKGMLKNGGDESSMFKLLQKKKRHVQGIKKHVEKWSC